MKIVIGVDLALLYEGAVGLLARLDFPDVEAVWAHCVESVLPDGGFAELGPAHPIGEVMAVREAAGRELLEHASAMLPGVTKELQFGDPASVLVQLGEDHHADLIAVGSERKGFFGSLFFGSVTKGLLISAKQSLLVAKKRDTGSGPIRAVFATDHSPYANRCAEELLRLAPRGISELVIVSAVIDHLPAALLQPEEDYVDLDDAIRSWETLVERENQELALKLAPLATTVTHQVRRGHANDVIRETMADTGSDLLILGAQGHGFLERLRIGSVSFHQVVSEECSTLVLRV